MCMSKIFITRPPSWALVSCVMIYSLFVLLPSLLFLMRLLHSETRLRLSLARSRYTHLNAEFQRIARWDKKPFLSDQCKEIEENNRMGKTRDLFKKIRDTKGTFHAKMGSIKDRNGMDLTEAENIKKRWQDYTEELYKKDLHDPDNHDGVITHIEPDILECKVKWALGSIATNKARELMEFQLSYSKSWKMMLWKCCTQYANIFGKLNSGHRTGKGQFSFQSQRKATPKNAQTTTQLHSSHTLVK